MNPSRSLVVNSAQRMALACRKVPVIGKMAGAVYRGVYNWYEGGWPIWTGGNTSWLPSLVQDARWDANYVTRREMLRRMRYWSQNSALLESILSVGERYTVGASGLHVSFYPDDDTSDDAGDAWYERAEKVVEEWFQSAGWNGETMELMLKIGYRCQRVDGEVFYIKTRKLGTVQYNGRAIPIQKPVLQMVEAHRVETPFNRFDDYNLIDGIQFTVVNAGQGPEKRQLLDKVGYWMRNGMGSFEQNDSYNLIEVENVFHIYDSQRVNMYRGVSSFYSCVMDLSKLEDLLDIEMKALATQSFRAVAYESASGQAGNPMDKKMEKLWAAAGKPCAPGSVDALQKEAQGRSEFWMKEYGAKVYGIKTGEKIHFDTPTRPSQSTLNGWEFLTNRICAGSHVPRCLVFEKISGESARSQGVEVRAQLDSADGFFKSDYQKWRNFVIGSVTWFMEWAVMNDERVADPPANWRDCMHIHQPEACNVDVGYTTTSQMMLLAAGANDYDMILGPQGTSFMAVAKRLRRQQRILEKWKIKVTLPALLPGQIPLDGKTEKKSEEVNA